MNTAELEAAKFGRVREIVEAAAIELARAAAMLSEMPNHPTLSPPGASLAVYQGYISAQKYLKMTETAIVPRETEVAA